VLYSSLPFTVLSQVKVCPYYPTCKQLGACLHVFWANLSPTQVNYTLEIMLGLESFATTDEHRIKPVSAIQHTRRVLSWQQLLIALERIGFMLCSITVSILVPEFSAMMAFLGAFSAFLLCVIGKSIEAR
jgi:hypothetical protein